METVSNDLRIVRGGKWCKYIFECNNIFTSAKMIQHPQKGGELLQLHLFQEMTVMYHLIKGAARNSTIGA